MLRDVVAFLDEQGFEVVGRARDGEAAVGLATELAPDLVIMDINMPVRDGISATEAITRSGIGPVVLMTALSHRDSYERASKAGALGYVTKPWRPEGLLPAIEIALARHRQIAGLKSEVAKIADDLEISTLMFRAKSLLGQRLGLSEAEVTRWLEETAAERELSVEEVARVAVSRLKSPAKVK